MDNEFKIIENSIVPIYQNKEGERLINARDLHKALQSKRQFANWIDERIKKYKFEEKNDFLTILLKSEGGRPKKEYILRLDVAKELCMIENNDKGRMIRKYFIEIEKRYKNIIGKSQNVFDIMHQALYQIEENEKRLGLLENRTESNIKQINKNINEIENIKRKIDVVIQKNYCMASDIAEELNLYSENELPHSNLIGAIARILGMKISYKHYYEDENIAIVPDVSKQNPYYQIYYKPKAVKEIIEWFNKNKEKVEYKIIYERNTKNGRKGEIKERGYKIENLCYRVKII